MSYRHLDTCYISDSANSQVNQNNIWWDGKNSDNLRQTV